MKNKIKTYVLTVSQYFPATHPRKGESTGFVEAIKDLRQYKEATKIHTIRANYPLWEKRIKEINEGKAVLSIRYWTGKPYNSKQEEILCLTGVWIQMVWFENNDIFIIDNNDYATKRHIQWSDLCKNDGLNIVDFENWFKGYDLSKPMAIIQFTNFRY